MMATFQQPGMPHQGMPGHPMGPGQGQPMHPGMQMHPGVSGPNGPHVSQAGPTMGGMHPGMGPGGPNAHAMQHLAPGGQPNFQQMGMGMQNNPAMIQAMQGHQQHQRFLAMQQQQQRAMLQQGQMPMSFQHNPQLAQQFAQMQPQGQIGPGQVNLTPHLQQQMNQQNQQRLLHMQQMQQQQSQQNQANQHVAMQHAPSQSSNQGQPPQNQGPGPQGPQVQPGQQPPMRPQSRVGGPQEAHSSPAPPQGPPQGQPQPQPQAQQQQQQQQQGPSQTPQQPPQPQQQPPQSQSNLQAQSNQNSQANAQQRPQMPADQMQRVLAQRAYAQQQQAQQAQQAQQQQSQSQGRMQGATILRLLQFADNLSRHRVSPESPNTLQHWQAFTSKFFSDQGTLEHHVIYETGKPRLFEIPTAVLARYFFSQFDGGLEHMQVTIDGALEHQLAGGYSFVEATRAKLLYWYRNGTHVASSGKLTVVYGQNGDLIDKFIFEASGYQQFVPRQQVVDQMKAGSPDIKQSPRMTKTPGKQRNQKAQLPTEPSISLSDLPGAPITEFGVSEPAKIFLEINETMARMQDLMYHSQQHPELTPSQCLQSLCDQYTAQQEQAHNQQIGAGQGQTGPGGPQHPQFNLPMNGTNPNAEAIMRANANLPPGARTPSGGQHPGQSGMPPNWGMSPAMHNQLLPGHPVANGSPHVIGGGPGAAHTPSPAMAHMQAPGMVAQHSQQGTSSTMSGASANTSPNVNNKRRRSTVKVEGDEGGGEKVKASPRVGGGAQAKRTKAG